MNKKSFVSRKTVLGKSPIHGKGVLAFRDIKKDEIIFYIKGEIRHLKINSPKDSEVGPCWIGIKNETWIDPISPAVYLNHSCNPNAGIRGKVTLRASKDINKGEEIIIDYSTTECDEFWSFTCHCGAKNCRKKVRSIQYLDKKTFNKYLPYIPKYFQMIYYRKNAI